VLLIADPVRPENNVDEATARRLNLPGILPRRLSRTPIALKAMPDLKIISPISTKRGIGVRAKFARELYMPSKCCFIPGTPPMKTKEAMIFINRNENAIGSPIAISESNPPKINKRTSHHSTEATPFDGEVIFG
jgi:hypothetical protein